MTRQEWIMDASAMSKTGRTVARGNGCSWGTVSAVIQRANKETRNHVAG